MIGCLPTDPAPVGTGDTLSFGDVNVDVLSNAKITAGTLYGIKATANNAANNRTARAARSRHDDIAIVRCVLRRYRRATRPVRQRHRIANVLRK